MTLPESEKDGSITNDPQYKQSGDVQTSPPIEPPSNNGSNQTPVLKQHQYIEGTPAQISFAGGGVGGVDDCISGSGNGIIGGKLIELCFPFDNPEHDQMGVITITDPNGGQEEQISELGLNTPNLFITSADSPPGEYRITASQGKEIATIVLRMDVPSSPRLEIWPSDVIPGTMVQAILSGFQPNEDIIMELSEPTKHPYTPQEQPGQVEAVFSVRADEQGRAIRSIPIPSDAQPGVYNLSTSVPSSSFGGLIEVFGPVNEPAPAKSPEGTQIETMNWWGGRNDTFTVRLHGYSPQQKLDLHLYQIQNLHDQGSGDVLDCNTESHTGIYHGSHEVALDDKGQTETPITLDPDMPTGVYAIVPSAMPFSARDFFLLHRSRVHRLLPWFLSIDYR